MMEEWQREGRRRQHFGCRLLLAMTVGWSCDAVLGGDAACEIKWGEGVAAAVMAELRERRRMAVYATMRSEGGGECLRG